MSDLTNYYLDLLNGIVRRLQSLFINLTNYYLEDVNSVIQQNLKVYLKRLIRPIVCFV